MAKPHDDPTEPKQRFHLGDFLYGQFRDAVADARTKLIDEAWFGRVSAEPSVAELNPTRPEQPESKRDPLGRFQSFEEQWAVREPVDQERDRRGQDIER